MDQENSPPNISPSNSSNGRGRRLIAGLLLVFFIAGGGYYGYRMGFFEKSTAKPKPVSEPLEKPVTPVTLSSEIINLSEKEKFEQAGKGKEELAYAIYQNIIETSASVDYKSKAQFFQAALLSQYLNKPQLAKAAFKTLLSQYPQSVYVDDAYYNLGLIHLDQDRLKEAVYNFTYLIDNYPKSNQIENAKFMAAKCSTLLAEMKREEKKESLNTKSVLTGILPSNLLALISFLCALGAPSAWIMMRIHDSEGHLVLFTSYPDSPKMQRNKVIQWILVITFFSLISTTFFINQHQKQQEMKQLIQMLQTSGIKTH